jgi:PPM family protein phosphatase
MWRSSKIRFDMATAVDVGTRDYQEDAVVADFPVGSDFGVGILADGMGGHSGGDVASALVVSEVFREMACGKAQLQRREADIPAHLRGAAAAANQAVANHVANRSQLQGMGSTLVATALLGPNLYWVSIGDSPLYLHRGRKLTRLNDDHSMAPQIDAMIALGQIKPEVGLSHPDRSCLTSAITGQKIARMHCPSEPFVLQAGDILVVSSDGLHSLSEDTIEQILRRNGKRPGIEIAETLIDAVRDQRLADQDNVSIIVIKVLLDKPVSQSGRPTSGSNDRPKTRFADSVEVFDAVVIDDEEPPAPARRAVGL